MNAVFTTDNLANFDTVYAITDVTKNYPSVLSCYLSEVSGTLGENGKSSQECQKWTGIEGLTLAWSGTNSDTLNSAWILTRDDADAGGTEYPLTENGDNPADATVEGRASRILEVLPSKEMSAAQSKLLVGTHTVTATLPSSFGLASFTLLTLTVKCDHPSTANFGTTPGFIGFSPSNNYFALEEETRTQFADLQLTDTCGQSVTITKNHLDKIVDPSGYWLWLYVTCSSCLTSGGDEETYMILE